MGAKQSTPVTGRTHIRCLDLVTKLLGQAQEITNHSSSGSLQFNQRQCRYRVKKLETAVQSANDRTQLSSAEELSVIDLDDWRVTGTWKYLVRLAMDVQSFIQNCCEKKHWIQAASMLINSYEHVVSLEGRLDLCIWSFKNLGRIMLETGLRQDLMNISVAQEHRSGELVEMFKNASPPLNLESFLNLRGRELAITLIGRLEAIIPVTVDQTVSLVELSVRDQVDLLGKVERALSSGSISNAEERQMATSLAERFLVSVGDPVSNKGTDVDFMRVNCESLRKERKLGTGAFGDVYKVQWLGISAAEKVFQAEDQDSREFWPDFAKEVSILARQSHPNIVRLLCYGKYHPKEKHFLSKLLKARWYGKDVSKEHLFKYSMVQELMEKDLAKLIEERMESSDISSESPQKPPFSIEEVVDILLQLAEGMDYLHRRKVSHRGLKPENILVKCEMCEDLKFENILAKVADFGISKSKERTITFSHPTWNQDLMPNDMKRKVLQDERPSLSDGLHEYPFYLRSMINQCWTREPSERPTFAEICSELRFMKLGALLIGRDLFYNAS